MALRFDPKLDSSDSASNRRSQAKNSAKGASAEPARSAKRSSRGKRNSSRGSTAASKPIKGKRKSVASKAAKKQKSSRPSSTGSISASRDISSANISERTRARRAGEIQKEQRAKRQKSQYRKFILRIIAAIGVVLLLIFGGIFLYRSDIFHVNNVQVNGVSHLTSQEITSIAAVSDDSTLLRLDAGGIISRLKDNAWVQDVSIHRVFPDTIEINITERAPGAVVDINEKSTWVISTDGTWLSAATTEDQQKAMHIIDVSPSLPTPISGTECTDGGIKNALSIMGAISDDLLAKIVSISAESSLKTSLNLVDGVTVAFGDSSDVEIKEAAINSLLSQYEGKISYINVRVPTRPTYRMVDSSEEYNGRQ